MNRLTTIQRQAFECAFRSLHTREGFHGVYLEHIPADEVIATDFGATVDMLCKETIEHDHLGKPLTIIFHPEYLTC
jgi:hypothetical protein